MIPVKLFSAELSFISEYQTQNNKITEEKTAKLQKKLQLNMDKTNSFSTVLLYDQVLKEKSYTWSLNLYQNTAKLKIILGHFNINFGSGLAFANSSNQFSFNNQKEKKIFYKYSLSAEPKSNHFGIGTSKEFVIATNKLFIYNFYLRDLRYINYEENKANSTSSSLSTIFNRTEKTCNYSTAVNLLTYGSAFYYYLNKYFSAATLVLQTKLTDLNNEKQTWSYQKTNTNYLTNNKIEIISQYLTYNDKFIKIFYEAACSIVHQQESVSKKTVKNYANQLGFRLRHHRIKTSLKYKHNQTAYNAPFSKQIESNYSNQAFVTENTIAFNNQISLTNYFCTQKKIKTSSSNSDEVYKFAEQYTLKTKPAKSLRVKISYKKNQNLTDLSAKKQLKLNIKLNFSKKSFADLSALIQENDANQRSYNARQQLQMQTFDYHFFKIDFAYSKIRERNSLTINLSRPHKSGSKKIYIPKTSLLVANHYSFKRDNLAFNCSSYNLFYKQKIYNRIFELSVNCRF
jgi:hypothetical protein